jgi:hypothetical protein
VRGGRLLSESDAGQDERRRREQKGSHRVSLLFVPHFVRSR